MDFVGLVNGRTELFGLIGDPVEHTRSPFIHNTLFKHLNINGVYIPIPVKPEHLEKAVVGLKAQNFSGFNITVPHKKDIIKYLDDISQDALLMGAVNTVKNVKGRLKGYNTDAEGFVRDFAEGFGTGFKDKRVMILGAGGTARALAVKLCAEGVAHLTIANRSLDNAENIVDLLKNNYKGMISSILSHPKVMFESAFADSEIIINTTPAGMSTYLDSTPFDYDFHFRPNQLIYDVIYTPKKTRFLKQAENCGCKVRNGFGMLINQGVSAFEIWTGKTIKREISTDLLNMLEKLEDL